LVAGGGGVGGGGGGAVRPQWKAAIDFKWIRDNRDAVADNIRSRNSAANLELVLELYDQYLALQKVRSFLNVSAFCSNCSTYLIVLC
jgi:seryl-tRNA synthetase